MCNSDPDTRALLAAVEGSLVAPLPSAVKAPSTRPVPTLTVFWSTEFQSLAVGGWSGKGKFALRSSISFPLSVFLSTADWELELIPVQSNMTT